MITGYVIGLLVSLLIQRYYTSPDKQTKWHYVVLVWTYIVFAVLYEWVKSHF
ncbi:hypothetical protein LEM8419_03554 [Neolewinella maritima]|uniref:Uncharacterized protein n=1 Tax=Neolewinella maritima TaxID=1383882 RepID=A0ABN8F6U4_9BACT|nr:hypothetical protein [Neolewinella maritima]CAH1002682.1 hypothetical protein LEM8419_03554 [Neolewinella maritima]